MKSISERLNDSRHSLATNASEADPHFIVADCCNF